MMSRSLRLASIVPLAAACLLSACSASPPDAGCSDDQGRALPCPVAVTPFVWASSIAVDGTNVYWASEYGSVQSCPVDGCNGPPLTLAQPGDSSPLAVAQGFPGPALVIATDGASVFWTTDQFTTTGGLLTEGAVEQCLVSGCGGLPTPMGQRQGTNEATLGGSIVVDSANVYWTDQGLLGSGSERAIMKCSLQGCTEPTVLAHQAESEPDGLSGLEDYLFSYVGPLTVDGVNAYWFHDGSLLACAVGGCHDQPTVLVIGQEATAIATDGTNVYWVAGEADGAVFSCPVTGCAGGPSELASHQAWPMAIATDGVDVYWVDQSTLGADGHGRVLRCATSGCDLAPETLAAGIKAGERASSRTRPSPSTRRTSTG